MKVVLKDSVQALSEKSNEELMPVSEFAEIYKNLEGFDYPHKDKLLEFIKYFFLDHIASKDLIFINFFAFKEHIIERKGISPSNVTPTKALSQHITKSGQRS